MRRFTPYMDLCSGECVTAFKNVSFYLADEAQAKIDKAIALLDVAICPQCQDKSGAYYDDHGQIYQCQWCHEVNELKKGK